MIYHRAKTPLTQGFSEKKSNFVNYVKLLCKQFYVYLAYLGRSALHASLYIPICGWNSSFPLLYLGSKGLTTESLHAVISMTTIDTLFRSFRYFYHLTFYVTVVMSVHHAAFCRDGTFSFSCHRRSQKPVQHR